MLLSLSGGAEDLRRDVRPDRQGWYCLLMQLLFGALLAMVYTDDLFTGYVFVEIAAVTACVAVAAKESGRSVVAAIRYLIFSCLGSGLVLLGIAMLYCITGSCCSPAWRRRWPGWSSRGSTACPWWCPPC